jgi:hypothetical protein
MTEGDGIDAEYLLDSRGLFALSNSGGNLFAVVEAAIKDGRVVTVARIHSDFIGRMPSDKVKKIKECNIEKKKVTLKYDQHAAVLAGNSNSNLSSQDEMEWIAAAFADLHGLCIITDEKSRGFYERIDGIDVMTLQEFGARES